MPDIESLLGQAVNTVAGSYTGAGTIWPPGRIDKYFTSQSKCAKLWRMTDSRYLLGLPIGVIAVASTLAYANLLPAGWFHAPWDKAAHAILYGWLAACAACTLPSAWRHWALTGPLLLAIADEVTQSLSRLRSADLWDLAADTAGICLAYFAVVQLRPQRAAGVTQAPDLPATKHA